MYEYHGWLSTSKTVDFKNLLGDLRKINKDYPVSVQNVNGRLHISFSGNPNRNLDQVEELISYLCALQIKVSGCVYINDSNSDRFNKFDIVKIIEDKSVSIEDSNFTTEETKKLFE